MEGAARASPQNVAGTSAVPSRSEPMPNETNTTNMSRRSWLQATAALAGTAVWPAHAELPDTIATVKASVLAVGYYRPTDNPRFTLGGTGFVIDDGRHVVTNHHVIDGPLRYAENTMLVVLLRGEGTAVPWRRATIVESDPVHDLVLLRFEGEPLPALRLGDS